LGIFLKPLIREEAEELDAVDLVGEGGAKRGGAGCEKVICGCDRPIGLVLPGFDAGGRIFK
jgi:hypothetical protein